MRTFRTAAVICLSLLCSLWVASALAQSAGGARRLTFDGRSTPLGWDASGLWFARPGALVAEGGQARIASELWLVDPVVGSQRQLSTDAPQRGRVAPAASPAGRVFVVDDGTLSPELWLAAPPGAPPRRLLKGQSETFGPPVLAPDGRRFVWVRTPTGSESEPSSAVWTGDLSGVAPRLLIAEATQPVWSPDGAELAFRHAGDLYAVDSRAGVGGWGSAGLSPSGRAGPGTAGSPSVPGTLTAPATLRVLHTQGNADFSQQATCRPPTLTVGSVMTFAFEAYVSYVLPIEASPSNPPEYLKAQAVAARTYAWARLNPSAQYDVSDWTDTQAMCDLRADPRTNAAANATASQYAAYNGALITAMYSAENGDPTRTNPSEFASPGSYPYLRAVDDPVSFGVTRSGHGQGLSQGGGQRWARNFGWDYLQILTHYYSGISVEGPGGFGSLIMPGNRGWQASNRIRIAGTANGGGTLDVWAAGEGLPPGTIANHTLLSALDIGGLPDQPLGALVISGTLGGTQAATLTLGIDRSPPSGTLTLPDFTTSPTVTLALSGSDGGPSGFAGYGLSNHWLWEGEEKKNSGNVLGAGTIVADAGALNGQALYAASGQSGVWYGPYTFALPAGHAYRAYFRLKSDTVTTSAEIAKIDVVADGVNPLGLRHLYGADFRAASAYQEFSVDFDYVLSTTPGLEFRVDFPGSAALWLDRILVATYPVTTPPTSWVLAPGLAPGEVSAKFSDNARNVSADVPSGAPAFTQGWLTTTTPLLSATTQDLAVGLDHASGRYRISSDGGQSWSGWLGAGLSGGDGSTALETLSASPALSDGASYRAQFAAGNTNGVSATSPSYAFKLDATPPAVAITSPAAAGAIFAVDWSGADALSGLASFDVQNRDLADGIWHAWLTGTLSLSAPFSGADGHTYQFRARAADAAGNRSAYSDSAHATTVVNLNLTQKVFLPLVARP